MGEQKCLSPGHWRIDGHDVVRVGYKTWDRSCIDWCIFAPGTWASPNTIPVHMTKGLTQARDWIRKESA